MGVTSALYCRSKIALTSSASCNRFRSCVLRSLSRLLSYLAREGRRSVMLAQIWDIQSISWAKLTVPPFSLLASHFTRSGGGWVRKARVLPSCLVSRAISILKKYIV